MRSLASFIFANATLGFTFMPVVNAMLPLLHVPMLTRHVGVNDASVVAMIIQCCII